jgi:hypothetical protein
MTCINCGNSATENFCPNCGQRTNVKRITFKEGWNDFWARIYGFDGMFPRTLRDLTLQPGIVAKKYIEGNRASYYGPVGYFFLMVTLYVLIMGALGIDFKEFLARNQSMLLPEEYNQTQNPLSQMAMEWVSNNIKIMAFIIMPFNAIAAHHLLFRKSNYNYVEHLVLPFYLNGHMQWLSILALLYFKITGSMALSGASFLISMVYFGFAYSQFIRYQSKIISFIKGVGVLVLGQLLMVSLLIIVVATLISLLPYISPETFELIRPSNNR